MRKLTERQQQILDLIRAAIEQTGFPPTRAEIAAQLGFSSPNAAEEHLRALARKGVIELTPGASRGIRLVESGGSAAKTSPLTALASLAGALELPLIGRVAAGQPILAAEHVDRHYRFDPAMFSRRPDYLLRVRGMSMRDAGILDGDLLAVQKTAEARQGEIVVARLGDEVTVKRLDRHPGGLTLVAENPDFSDIEVDPDRDDFSLEGIAVGLIRDARL